MMEEPLYHKIAAQRAGRTVSPPIGLGDLWEIKMRPEARYIQLVGSVSKHWLLVSSFSSYFWSYSQGLSRRRYTTDPPLPEIRVANRRYAKARKER